MTAIEALTKLVVGMSRLGDYLLRQKVSGIIVATLAFACGAVLDNALRGETLTPPAAPTVTSCGAPDSAEVSMRDTSGGKVGGGDEGAAFEGRYENNVFGYSVEIPAGMVGVGATRPAPQHGFVVDLEDTRAVERRGRQGPPRPYVSVDGRYNSLEWGRLDEAADDQLTYLDEKVVRVRVLSRVRTTLAGLPAVRVVARYERDGETWVSDDTVALRRSVPSDDVSVAYTLDMDTPLSRYERDRPVLDALLESWCLQPIE